MRLLACTVMLFCSLALVRSFPLEDSSSSVIQQVETKQSGQERELIRDKRTIGILRDLFPNFSQIIDRKIQMLTRIIFRLVGRLVLGGGGGAKGGGGDDSGTGVSVVLPTYPPSEDDDEDEDEDEDSTSSADSDSAASQPATTTQSSQSDDENKVEETKERKKRQAIDTEVKTGIASDNNEVSEESGLEDDEDRDKRFLNFNAAASGTANSAGSGNFLFDVIRLVAGSGNTEEGDEAANTPLEGAGSEHHETSKGYDGLGVPGPLTRLFVIANRGVASLIQDLILRLAQTSEKLVSFKARLITSII